MKMIQQRTTEWFAQRKLRITGSRVGAILDLSPWQKPADVLRAMVREYHGAESEFKGNPATDHGMANEQRALLCFMRESCLMVEQCGFFEYGDSLGASPDGLTSDGGVLELKVPFGLRDGGEFKTLAEQPHYFCQVQLEMLSAGRNHAYFAQYIAPKGDPLAPDYVPEQINIERVERDPHWLDNNLTKISDFYRLLLSELNNEEHLEPLRVQFEADEIIGEIDALRERQKADAEREKELVGLLVEMADGKDAEVSGRRLTLVKRQGSISYANAIKELLPDANLEKWRGEPSESWRLY